MQDQKIATADHQIIDEHQALQNSLREVQTLVADRSANVLEVLDQVVQFNQQVLNHFDHEEEDGYFIEILEVAPWLSAQIASLRAQHDQFREQLRSLCEFVQTGEGTRQWWSALDDLFDKFTRLYLAHEHAEDSLFQEAYNRDFGGED